jgi:hypothetical protein
MRAPFFVVEVIGLLRGTAGIRSPFLDFNRDPTDFFCAFAARRRSALFLPLISRLRAMIFYKEVKRLLSIQAGGLNVARTRANAYSNLPKQNNQQHD